MDNAQAILPPAFALLFIALLAQGGLAETTCQEQDCGITITIKIAFAGATDQQIQSWKDDIEDVWNGPYGSRTTGECQCTVSFKVETMKITNASQVNCNPPPQGYHCVMVTHWDGTDQSLPFFYNSSGQKEYVVGYMGYSTQSPSQGGASIDGWWSDAMNRPAPDGGTYHDAAHEAGHMMGLADREGDGLMTHTSGEDAQPTQDNIDKAVENVCGADACPDRCCCGNGVIDSGKGESCDPFAVPTGCSGGDFCCPVCCSCYSRSCIPSDGEYLSQEDCQAACGQGSSCYLNYRTGCWDCVGLTVVEETLYDPAQARATGQAFHMAHDSLSGLEDVVSQEMLEMVRDMYNNNINSAPAVRDLLANERINFYIEGMGVISIVNVDGEMDSIEIGEMEDPSMNMYTDEATIEEMVSGSLDPVDALKQGRITYEGVGIANWFRFALANFIFGIMSALGMV